MNMHIGVDRGRKSKKIEYGRGEGCRACSYVETRNQEEDRMATTKIVRRCHNRFDM